MVELLFGLCVNFLSPLVAGWLQQNKPYSVLNIHDNLHGIIKKPVCQRILDTLAEKYVCMCRRVGSYACVRE